MMLKVWMFSIFFTLMPAIVLACSCMPKNIKDVQSFYDNSYAVFEGTVVDYKTVGEPYPCMGEDSQPCQNTEHTFQISKVWKGNVGNTAIVKSSTGGGSLCMGSSFPEQSYYKKKIKYLIFTDKDDMSVNSVCSPIFRTTEDAHTRDDAFANMAKQYEQFVTALTDISTTQK